MIAETDPATCFPITIRTCVDVPSGPPGPVALLGYAIHPMTPAAGSGANTALRDAALLTEQLAAVDAGRLALLPALAAYSERMRRSATDAVHLSLRNSDLEHLLS